VCVCVCVCSLFVLVCAAHAGGEIFFDCFVIVHWLFDNTHENAVVSERLLNERKGTEMS